MARPRTRRRALARAGEISGGPRGRHRGSPSRFLAFPLRPCSRRGTGGGGPDRFGRDRVCDSGDAVSESRCANVEVGVAEPGPGRRAATCCGHVLDEFDDDRVDVHDLAGHDVVAGLEFDVVERTAEYGTCRRGWLAARLGRFGQLRTRLAFGLGSGRLRRVGRGRLGWRRFERVGLGAFRFHGLGSFGFGRLGFRRPPRRPLRRGRGLTGSVSVQVFAGPERSLGTVGHAEALVHAREVCLHRPFRDAEAAGDLLVGETFAYEEEHLTFAFGEL